MRHVHTTRFLIFAVSLYSSVPHWWYEFEHRYKGRSRNRRSKSEIKTKGGREKKDTKICGNNSSGTISSGVRKRNEVLPESDKHRRRGGKRKRVGASKRHYTLGRTLRRTLRSRLGYWKQMREMRDAIAGGGAILNPRQETERSQTNVLVTESGRRFIYMPYVQILKCDLVFRLMIRYNDLLRLR